MSQFGTFENLLTPVVGDRYRPFDVIEVEVTVPPPIPRMVSQTTTVEEPKPATVPTPIQSEVTMSPTRRRWVWENPTPTTTLTTGPAVLLYEEYVRRSRTGMQGGGSCPGIGRRAI